MKTLQGNYKFEKGYLLVISNEEKGLLVIIDSEAKLPRIFYRKDEQYQRDINHGRKSY